jgi:hypothetical protein
VLRKGRKAEVWIYTVSASTKASRPSIGLASRSSPVYRSKPNSLATVEPDAGGGFVAGLAVGAGAGAGPGATGSGSGVGSGAGA